VRTEASRPADKSLYFQTSPIYTHPRELNRGPRVFSMQDPRLLKRRLVQVCHLLAEKDYVSGTDGNVSCRLPGGRFLTTPTMVHKAFVTEEDLLVVDATGRKLEGPEDRQPTSEIFMHLAVYANRPDVHAVVHAHPPTAVAFTIAGESLARCVLPEVVLTLGQIPTAPYQTAGSRDLAQVVGDLMVTYDAVLLERHGAICAGRDLVDAFGKMEKVEHTAMITHRARTLGQVRELDCAEVERLRQLGAKYGARGAPTPSCDGCDGCPTGIPWQDRPDFEVVRATLSAPETRGSALASVDRFSTNTTGGLEQIVTEEILRALSGRLSSH